MGRLSAEQRGFVVTSLAAFRTPTEVSRELEAEFGVVMSAKYLARYDPTRAGQFRLAGRWRELFFATRERFIRETGDIAIANQAWRLQEYLELYRQLGPKSIRLKAELLQLAAKDSGGMFSNRREISGPGGSSIAVEASAKPDLSRLSRAQLDQLEAISVLVFEGVPVLGS